VLEGLEGKDVNVIATLGPDRDPHALGPQPANIHLFGYVPQAQLLGRCDLVICHGGAGSTFGALSFGLPLLILPRGADNFYNPERVLSAGAGRSLLDAEITAEAVANEVAFLLTDDNCHNAAAPIADEITAMPAPARAVTALENLAATRPSSPSASLASL
jgi:UDP:flavonoid glycosyltransferase YjiC (YdhE family)